MAIAVVPNPGQEGDGGGLPTAVGVDAKLQVALLRDAWLADFPRSVLLGLGLATVKRLDHVEDRDGGTAAKGAGEQILL
jgi:hypothetical protein